MTEAPQDRRITTASLTDVGLVRQHNEDYCDQFERGGHRLLVVADGMGGHKGGATASRVAVQTIGEAFQTSDAEPAQFLAQALSAANDSVYRMSLDNPELRGMGTTVVALLLGPGERAWVGHVGDSRAYRTRDGQIEPLTADHSVVAEMTRRGLLTPEEAAVHPRRNEILRSIGVEATVEPEVGPVDVKPGDAFLLCTDGLSGVVADEEIGDVVRSEPPGQAVRILVDLANDLGGTDNVTIQIAAVRSAGRTVEAPPSADAATSPRRLVGLVAISAGLVALLLLLLLLSRG